MVSGRFSKDWDKDAACRGMDPEDFYSEFATTPVPSAIQRICDTCPVQGECLAHALKNRESGIWGGTNETHRNAILSRTSRKYCLRCKGRSIYENKRFMICLSCGISWRIS